jgi:hypothetical protein
MRLIVCFLMTITILLTTAGSNSLLAGAQQTGPSEVDINETVDDNMSQISNESLSNDNQSPLIPDPIRGNSSQVESGPAGEVGPPGPPGPAGEVGNNTTILRDNLYINNGTQQSTSEDSFITASATCNENDIPLSGGYSIVREDEEEDSGELNEIESIPNLQNNSWTINVEGDDIQVTPYVVCLTMAQ